MLSKYIDNIYHQIASQNSQTNMDAVPHSNTFLKKMEAQFGYDEELLKKIIFILKESHFILVMEISKEDKNHDVARIEGYVDADIETVRRLADFFQNALLDAYEKQYRKRISFQQVIKDLLPQMGSHNNSIMGNLANKAVMLKEFELLLSRRLAQYSNAWKIEKLAVLIMDFENRASIQ